MTLPKAKAPAAMPVLLAVTVQLKELPNGIVLLTLFVFVMMRSARLRNTVTLSVFDVTPFIVAEAVLVTDAARKSAAVTV